jgi:hypothetical protein
MIQVLALSLSVTVLGCAVIALSVLCLEQASKLNSLELGFTHQERTKLFEHGKRQE